MKYYKSWHTSIIENKALWENDWVKWVHHPKGQIHCPECLQLDGCFFLRVKAPICPHHYGCHCTLDDIAYAEVEACARATSDYRKFDPYLFNTNGCFFSWEREVVCRMGLHCR